VSGTGSGKDRGQGSTRTIRSGSKDWDKVQGQGSRKRGKAKLQAREL
jgi:hypothetical protein